jgi:hypothetical protein
MAVSTLSRGNRGHGKTGRCSASIHGLQEYLPAFMYRRVRPAVPSPPKPRLNICSIYRAGCSVRIELQLFVLPVDAVEIVMVKGIPSQDIKAFEAFCRVEPGLLAQTEGVNVGREFVVA